MALIFIACRWARERRNCEEEIQLWTRIQRIRLLFIIAHASSFFKRHTAHAVSRAARARAHARVSKICQNWEFPCSVP